MAARRDTDRTADDGSTRERLVDAAVAVLAEEGPAEMKVRRISDKAGSSTITVYHHFGNVGGLLDAVVARGYATLTGTLEDAAASNEDPGVQLFAMALGTRGFAQRNPHLYDLMFGLSPRGTYRASAPLVPQQHFREAYAVLVRSCHRLVAAGRVDIDDPEQIAAQLWSLVHGFVSLEAAGHFADHSDAVASVLAPMAVAQLVGIGDDRARATRGALTAYATWTATAVE
ncbi:TetR/AcrR family transcriptional regulator [Rhodococcus sp. BP-316]|uniref:TetR/AcrR family transcriptional regulator n=1 Tax=Rhodococcus sp. BP-316 TaxID=2739445 RepID=UPI001C9A7B07|nr:TetR/AcrR family transcriptional regulator [Rhodococcus sp. BP-316]MBY6682912.1 TetR/AcrR family transcriptional regulator [Rhodococcus sp. BP-316]